MMNMAMYRSARDARKEKDRAVKFAKGRMKKGSQKTLTKAGENYLDRMRFLLTHAGVNPAGDDFNQMSQLTICGLTPHRMRSF